MKSFLASIATKSGRRIKEQSDVRVPFVIAQIITLCTYEGMLIHSCSPGEKSLWVSLPTPTKRAGFHPKNGSFRLCHLIHPFPFPSSTFALAGGDDVTEFPIHTLCPRNRGRTQIPIPLSRKRHIVPVHACVLEDDVLLTHPFLFLFSRALPHLRRGPQPGDRDADAAGSLLALRGDLVSRCCLTYLFFLSCASFVLCAGRVCT